MNVCRVLSISLVLVLALVGCGPEKRGYYEGYLEVRKALPESPHGRIRGFLGSKWVAAEIKRRGWDGRISVFDPKTGDLLLEPIVISSRYGRTFNPLDINKINLVMPSLLAQFELRRSKGCFTGSSLSGEYDAKICFKDHQVLEFDITEGDRSICHLSAAPFSRPKLPRGGIPLILREAMEIALKTNPASNIELEHRFQSKMMTFISASTLTPKINASIFNIAQSPFNPFAYLQLLGGLAPFLSPVNWANTIQANLDRKVANLSYRIVQANLAAQVEGLVYQYRRDLVLLNESRRWLDRVANLLRRVSEIEGETEAPPTRLKFDLEALAGEIRNFQIFNLLPLNRSALARTIGVHDLDTIRNIKIGPEEFPIETAFDSENLPIKLEKNKIAAEAAAKSLDYMERRQAKLAATQSLLTRIGRIIKMSKAPGDNPGGTGLKVIWQNSLGKSLQREAWNNEMFVYDEVRQIAIDSTEAYNQALMGYKEAQRDLGLSKRVLDEILLPIEQPSPGINLRDHLLDTRNEIRKRFEDYIGASVRVVAYHAGYRIARGMLDRLLLRGIFAKIAEAPEGHSLPPLDYAGFPMGKSSEDDLAQDDWIDPKDSECYSQYFISENEEAACLSIQ